MNPMMRLSEQLHDFFEITATAKARTTKFVQRASKLSGALFAKVLVLGFIHQPEASLNQLSQDAADLGVNISAQGLDQRLTDKAVDFLKALFVESLKRFRNPLPLDLPLLQQFSALYLQDSSTIALPDNLQSEFAGCGGDGPVAALKVQLLFEFLRGNLQAIVWQAGRAVDQAYDDYVAQVQPDSLTVQDLGFFELAHFGAIAAKQAYFLSRFKHGTTLLDPETGGAVVDLLNDLAHETRNTFERDLRVGTEAQLPCRVCFFRLTQEQAEQRRRKAKAEAQRKGRTVSPRTLQLLDWSIYITNVPATILSLPQVALLYRVRWQIELVFKLWKSVCALNRIAGLRRARVLCELYAKMIGIVLTHRLFAPLRLGRVELSLVKARQLLQDRVMDIARHLDCSAKLSSILQTLAAHVLRFAVKTKRTRKPSTLQQLQLEAPPA